MKNSKIDDYEKSIYSAVLNLNPNRPELPDIVIRISKKYGKIIEIYNYLLSDGATYCGMVQLLSSFNPNTPPPFKD